MASEESLTNIKVAIRCRPLNSKEIGNGDANCVRVNGSQITLFNPSRPSEDQHNFGFDLIFDEHSKQEELWSAVGVPTLEKAFSGYNGTIFAYGQTGSGKTWSMQGGENEYMGIIPRMSIGLFENIESAKNRNSSLRFLVTASYFEIYNEILNDLLDNKDNKQKREKGEKGGLEIKEHPVLGVYIKNITEIVVDESSNLLALIERGSKNRKVAMTNMNTDSSRSHSILTLVIHQKDSQDESKNVFAKVNLVDLAGSERQKSTNATGSTLKEGANINKSLSALGNVINALVEASNNSNKSKPVFVPYRNSKLTRVLQESLGGNSMTVMLAMLSASFANLEESLSCLKYANRAKDIKVKVVKNEESSQLSKLNEEIRLLKEKLAGGQAHQSSANPTDSEAEERYRSHLADLETLQHKSWQEKLDLSKQYELEMKRIENDHKAYEMQMKAANETNWKLLIEKNDIELTMNHLKGLTKRISQLQNNSVNSIELERSTQFYTILNDVFGRFQMCLKSLLKNEDRLKEQFTITNLNLSGVEKEFSKLIQGDADSLQSSPARGATKSSFLSESDISMIGSKLNINTDISQRLNNNNWKILRDKLNVLRVESAKLAKLQNENIQIILQLQNDADSLVRYLERDFHIFPSSSSTLDIDPSSNSTLDIVNSDLKIASCWGVLSTEDHFEVNRGVKLLQRQVNLKYCNNSLNIKASRLSLFNIAKYGDGAMRYLSNYFSSSDDILSTLATTEDSHSIDGYRDTRKKIARDYDSICVKIKAIRELIGTDNQTMVSSSSSSSSSTSSMISQSLLQDAALCAKVDCSINSQLYLRVRESCDNISVNSENCWFSKIACDEGRDEVYVEFILPETFSICKLLVRAGKVPVLEPIAGKVPVLEPIACKVPVLEPIACKVPAESIPEELAIDSQGDNSSTGTSSRISKSTSVSLSELSEFVQTYSVNGISLLSCDESAENTSMLVSAVTDWEILVKKTPPDKFLRRPPVKFCFDVIMHFVDITSAGGRAVNTPTQLDPRHDFLFPRDVAGAAWETVGATKTSKMEFMDLILAFVSKVTRQPPKTVSNNIVTGVECGLTNLFLQELTLIVSAYKFMLDRNENLPATKPSAMRDISTWMKSAKLAISKDGIDWGSYCDCEFEVQGSCTFEFVIPSALSSLHGKYVRIFPKKWDYDRTRYSKIASMLGPSLRVSVMGFLFAEDTCTYTIFDKSNVVNEDPATNTPRSPRVGSNNSKNCIEENQILSVLQSLQESCRVIVIIIDFLNNLFEFQSSKKQEEALKRIEGLSLDHKALEVEKESLLKQVQDLLMQLQVSQEQNANLRISNDELYAENTTIKSEIELLRGNRIHCDKSIEKLNKSNTDLENEVESLKIKLDHFEVLEIERTMIADQINVIREERDNSRATEEVLFGKVGALAQELELLQDSYVLMTDRLNEVMDENMDLKDKIDDIRNNSSSSSTPTIANKLKGAPFSPNSKLVFPIDNSSGRAAVDSSASKNASPMANSIKKNDNDIKEERFKDLEPPNDYDDDFDGYDDEFEKDD